MVINRSLFRREPSLRPAHRPGLPVGRTLLRAGLVAALLTLAAGVVYARESPTRCPAAAPAGQPVEAGSAPPPSPGRPAGGDSGAGRSRNGDSGAGRLALPDGLVGVPVRLADAAPAAVVRAGDRVDLLAVPEAARPAGSATPMLVATRALVLDVATEGLADDSTALYLALPAEQARRVTALGAGHRLAIMVRS